MKELKVSKKINLKPGESKTVELSIDSEHLAYANIDKEGIVEPGEFEIMVGTSTSDQYLTKVTLTVE